jgi:hypothetical protein
VGWPKYASSLASHWGEILVWSSRIFWFSSFNIVLTSVCGWRFSLHIKAVHILGLLMLPKFLSLVDWLLFLRPSLLFHLSSSLVSHCTEQEVSS